jgi:dinuclear metal center YbgI/SA1388 family protein
MLEVGTVAGWMQEWYPPATAEAWDRVGLISGSRTTPVTRVLLAVDPVEAVGEQARALGAQMVITHHPLYLRGTSFVSEDDAKGRLIAGLIRSNIALLNAHTNADVARGGVAQALADLVGIVETVPMVPVADDPTVGLGRIGRLPSPMRLGDFADVVASALPAGPNGILVGGDPDRLVTSVAVSGGSGDSFLALAGDLGADAYVTADLRHHPASEHLEEGGPALICGSHWATEWSWLPVLARQLVDRAAAEGEQLEVVVSQICTEPWFEHLATTGSTQDLVTMPNEGAPA